MLLVTVYYDKIIHMHSTIPLNDKKANASLDQN